MDQSTIVEFDGRDGLSDSLNDLLKKGAETLLKAFRLKPESRGIPLSVDL